jgi:hypothetical protein
LFNAATLIQKYTKGFLTSRSVKAMHHRSVVDYYLNYWMTIKIKNHTNLQVKLKYAFKHYKIKKKKKADRKKALAKKKKGKKKKKKTVDPNDKLVKDTGDG